MKLKKNISDKAKHVSNSSEDIKQNERHPTGRKTNPDEDKDMIARGARFGKRWYAYGKR